MLNDYQSTKQNETGDATNKNEESISTKKHLIRISVAIGCLVIGIIFGLYLQQSDSIINNNNNNSNKSSHVFLEDDTVDSTESLDDVAYAYSQDVFDFSPNAERVNSWPVKARISDLAVGNIVVIRSAYWGTMVRVPPGSNKVKLIQEYSSNRDLWLVGKNSNKGYTFRSIEEGCYLQSRSGSLKCLSTVSDAIYWKFDNSVFAHSAYDTSDYERYYTKLECYDDNKCAKAISYDDDEIDMGSDNCDSRKSGYTFEIANS